MRNEFSIIHELLKRFFNIVDFEIKGLIILKTETCLSIFDVIQLLCENEDDEDRVLIDYLEVYNELKIGVEGILSFEYQSIGPMVFSHSLSKNDFGDSNFYVIQSIDGQDPRIIASLDKDTYPVLLPTFLKRYYSSNGSQYSDDEMFWSLPSTTFVYDPNIDVELLKDCYRLFLDNIVERYPNHDSWFGERDEMLSIFDEPNVMKRSLKLIKNIPKIENISHYLKELGEIRDKELSNLTDPEKEIILTLLIYYKTDFMNSTE